MSDVKPNIAVIFSSNPKKLDDNFQLVADEDANRYFEQCISPLNKLGANVCKLDWTNFHYGDHEDLKVQIRAVMGAMGVDGIVLPGNYYHLSGEGVNPDSRRELFTAALLEVAEEKNLPEIGFCGGLQAKVYNTLDQDQTSIKTVKEMVEGLDVGQGEHNFEDPSTPIEKISEELMKENHEIYLQSGNKLFEIASEFVKSRDLDGSAILDINSAHNYACSNDPEIEKRLEANGLSIVGRAADGTIEIIMNSSSTNRSQIYFQGHPEVKADYKDPLYTEIIKELFIVPARAKAEERIKEGELEKPTEVKASKFLQTPQTPLIMQTPSQKGRS